MADAKKKYDIVLYGASGFTGKQTVAYFKACAPAQLSWAIAGRNQTKLAAVRDELAPGIDVLVAAGDDRAALDDITSNCRVMLTTAGPYVKYGSELVASCVAANCHYVDITGETYWVKTLIDQHHEQAAAQGTRIVPFCGFDSVPSDIGSYYIKQQLQKPLASIKAYHRGAGGFNGGTAQSMLTAAEQGSSLTDTEAFLLNPEQSTNLHQQQHSQDDNAIYPLSQLNGFAMPFIMGVINTRVVRRSAALHAQQQNSYGVNFVYQEYGLTQSKAAAYITRSVLAAVGGLVGSAITRPLMRKIMPDAGVGPSEEAMDNGWFKVDYLVETESGDTAHFKMSGQGDPGNRSTVRMLCESALCLALEQDLPGGAEFGGVLTPATAMGDSLVRRLQAAGITFEQVA